MRHARGVERLDRVELFTGARKLDRRTGDKAHRECRTAARITIHTGQHHACKRHLLGEVFRYINGVLPREAVDDQQDFLRRGDIRHRLHLVHQRLIDMEAARGIEHHHVKALQLRGLQSAARNLDRALARDDRQRRHVALLAQHSELLLRRRAIDVQ